MKTKLFKNNNKVQNFFENKPSEFSQIFEAQRILKDFDNAKIVNKTNINQNCVANRENKTLHSNERRS